MIAQPAAPEIDHRTMKLIVGIVALSLATLTSLFAGEKIASISASYYEGGWSQTIFIGFLFAIASFLLAYNGADRLEMVLSKIASVAALGIALFPCECSGHPALVPYLHGLSTAVMFLILAFFCYRFYLRAQAKGHTRAKARSWIYAACGIAMVLAIAVLAIDQFSSGAISAHVPRLVFYGEATGLIAFGISWLTASHALPLITEPGERYTPLTPSPPTARSMEE